MKWNVKNKLNRPILYENVTNIITSLLKVSFSTSQSPRTLLYCISLMSRNRKKTLLNYVDSHNSLFLFSASSATATKKQKREQFRCLAFVRNIFCITVSFSFYFRTFSNVWLLDCSPCLLVLWLRLNETPLSNSDLWNYVFLTLSLFYVF